MFFRENPGKSLSDFNELQKKALLERMIEFNEQSKKKDEEIEFSTPEFQPPKKRIFGPLITKDEWKETSFLHKIWIVFVLAGVTALIFLYLKEIVLFIAAVAVSVIAIIALIIISQFFH